MCVDVREHVNVSSPGNERGIEVKFKSFSRDVNYSSDTPAEGFPNEKCEFPLIHCVELV